MNVMKAHKFDDAYKEKMLNCVESDPDVQFHWTVISADMDDETSEKLSSLIVSKWITI